MPPPALFDLSQIDFSRVLFDSQAIRAVLPQRGEMDQLTAIVHVDTESHGLVGYKEVTDREFWIQGHMPDFPLMPGVIMCEAAAQLAAFYAKKFSLLGGDFVAFGGLDDVRFRGPVYPNSRLVLAAKLRRFRKRAQATFDFQGFIGERMVFSGGLIGVPMTFGASHAQAASS